MITLLTSIYSKLINLSVKFESQLGRFSQTLPNAKQLKCNCEPMNDRMRANESVETIMASVYIKRKTKLTRKIYYTQSQ